MSYVQKQTVTLPSCPSLKSPLLPGLEFSLTADALFERLEGEEANLLSIRYESALYLSTDSEHWITADLAAFRRDFPIVWAQFEAQIESDSYAKLSLISDERWRSVASVEDSDNYSTQDEF